MTVEAGMNFSMGAIEEAAEAAKNAEFTGGNYVKEPGAYHGIVETAMFKKFPSGAGGVEIAIKTEEGQTCKIMIITMKKDGTSTYKNAKGEFPLPGINQIRGALMPCLRQRELAATQNGDEIIYTSVVGQPLGMLVNIRKTLGKTNGKPDPNKVYENADLKTFYCPKTNLCGSEILNKINTPERKDKIMESLKTIDETAIVDAPATVAGAGSAEKDPFAAENTAGTDVADPFAAETADTTATTTTTTTETPATTTPVETPPVETAATETPAAAAAADAVSTPPADDFWN